MRKDKFLLGLIIGGALLVAGLFSFLKPHSSEVATGQLKPSQLDFRESNQIKPPEKLVVTAPPQTEVALSPDLKEEDKKKIKTFEEILNSKNDNDPRVDSELKSLSAEVHQNLQKAYSQMPKENRNGRGFVAFLIARDLKSVEDARFLKGIYEENPCLSFQDCSKEGPSDPHIDGINQTSLNYPQLAALYQLERKLESQPDLLNQPEMRNELLSVLREAQQFPSDSVQKRAQNILSKFKL